MKRVKGFTLIELMIVVAIIGILAAIAIPYYQAYAIKAKISEGFSLAASAQTAVVEAYSANGLQGVSTLSTNWNANPVTSKYVQAVYINYPNGEIDVVFNPAAFPTFNCAGPYSPACLISLQPNVGSPGNYKPIGTTGTAADTAIVDWACASYTALTATAQGLAVGNSGSVAVPSQYAPGNCT